MMARMRGLACPRVFAVEGSLDGFAALDDRHA
jgi:hypothetical protein